MSEPSSRIGRALVDVDLSERRTRATSQGPGGAGRPSAVNRHSTAQHPATVIPLAIMLIPEQRALLERLAGGDTIAAAAAAEFLSLRTANRRIARAREILGVRTTREAVVAYLRQRQQG